MDHGNMGHGDMGHGDMGHGDMCSMSVSITIPPPSISITAHSPRLTMFCCRGI